MYAATWLRQAVCSGRSLHYSQNVRAAVQRSGLGAKIQLPLQEGLPHLALRFARYAFKRFAIVQGKKVRRGSRHNLTTMPLQQGFQPDPSIQTAAMPGRNWPIKIAC